MNIAIFASGSGSNFQQIVNNINSGFIDGKINLLVSDNPNAFVLERAKKEDIKFFDFNPKEYENKEKYEKIILNKLLENKIELIVLAGYLRIIGKTLLSKYEGKIINIHPSLLPKHKGLDAINKSIIAKDKFIGVTVHYVDKGMDTGKIIEQVAIENKNYNFEEASVLIHKIEHELYSKVIKKIIEKEI